MRLTFPLFGTAAAISWRRTLGVGVLGALGVGAVLWLLLTGHGRLALTLMLLELFVAMATVNVRVAILAVFAYLIVLGDLRRLLIPLFGWSGLDPLLVVGSVFALVVVAGALVNREIRFDTKLAKWTLALMAIMVLQIFNPKQGGLMVGLAGAMFLIVPICWFWVGRTYATPAFMRTLLYGLVLPLALVAAAYGTYQVFFGYLPHQQRWLEMNWYQGLGSPNNPSPISLFASNTEYGKFLSIGVVLAWAAFLKGNRMAGGIALILLVAVALTGIRGPLFFSLAMMVGLWAVLSRSTVVWVLRGGLAAVVAIVGLTVGLTTATQLDIDPRARKRLERQAQEFVYAWRGQTDYSSADKHFSMMLGGYLYSLSNPFGLGIGSVTKAALKFGGRAYNTETHLGNSFVALGLPGGVLYHVIIFLIILYAFRYWIFSRSLISLAILGILGVTMASLLAGEAYAVGPLTAFCAGAIDRLYSNCIVNKIN
ncbi:hypothetical protein [Rhodothermus profundi]|uniref:O-antigen ligase like membrane protein n=1 Tax=Rhodothermus profundi TaxID=633813 RepID=A0A1M6XK41_9BACT|nr:hypothetical protein [Rhodothermus profundi]SHL06321.1 hypothetical protein SAMN04488087_2631 [Rhodothermus profundi]